MRITAVVLALVATQASADLAFKGDGFDVRLKGAKCTHPKVVDLIKDEWAPKYRQGFVMHNGRKIQMCWIRTGQGSVFIVDEDGVTGELEERAFQQVPTV